MRAFDTNIGLTESDMKFNPNEDGFLLSFKVLLLYSTENSMLKYHM